MKGMGRFGLWVLAGLVLLSGLALVTCGMGAGAGGGGDSGPGGDGLGGAGGGDGGLGGGGGFRPTVARTGKVIAVSNGGELVLEGGETVRYEGVSVPATGARCCAESRDRSEALLLGKEIGLDPCDAAPVDGAGRTVAYVVVQDGGAFVNRALIAEGWALAASDESCGKQTLTEFANIQNEAKSGEKGIHGPNCSGDPGGPVGTIEIVVAESVFNPPGDDSDHLNEQFVVFRAKKGDVTLTGWKVSSRFEFVYTFPTFVLLRDAKVKLHSGRGTNSATDLYWGSDWPIWNDFGDEVTVRDAHGTVVASYEYGS